MPNIYLTCTNSNGVGIAGLTVVGHAFPSNGGTDCGETHTTDTNGVAVIATPPSAGWLGGPTYAVSWDVTGAGYQEAKGGADTGQITGDVYYSQTVLSTGGKGGGSGLSSPGTTANSVMDAIDPYLLYIILGVVAVVVIIVMVRYRGALFSGMKKGAKGVARFAKG